MRQKPDLEVFHEATRKKISFPERVALVNKIFPSTVRVEWKKVWDEDIGMLGDLINDMVKADQAVPGRPGKRAAVSQEVAKQRLRVFLGDDYSIDPFAYTFRLLVKDRSIRNVATKTGLDRNLIHRLLQGKVEPDFYAMEQIAAAFGKTPDFFVEYRVGFIAGLMMDRLEKYPESSVHFYRKMRGLK